MRVANVEVLQHHAAPRIAHTSGDNTICFMQYIVPVSVCFTMNALPNCPDLQQRECDCIQKAQCCHSKWFPQGRSSDPS